MYENAWPQGHTPVNSFNICLYALYPRHIVALLGN